MAAPTTTPTHKIRYALPSDVPTILTLLRELASYEKELVSCKTTEEMLLSTLSFPITNNPTTSPSTPTEFTKGYARTILISPADNLNSVAGLAVYFPNYSTWTGPGIYIEDMIVTEAQRGKGYGTALLAAVAREVEGVNGFGMGRLQWSVLKWNEPAIGLFFSERVGAFEKTEYLGCQVEGKMLVELAGRV